MIRQLAFLFLCLALVAGAGRNAYAGLIRDAEIEATLRSYADPIFKVAGLKPSAINIYIVQDNSLNAFVAGGSNLFIHTGIITSSPTPDMLLGVMAHETGHIAGGHLAKGSEKLKDAQFGTIMAMVLGAAAGAATGKPEAAAAVMSGANSGVERNFFSFTRANENAADQAALGFLDKLGISAEGMVKVFEMLKQQERQHFGAPDPYLRTHPLTNERIEHVRDHVEAAKIDDHYSGALLEKHKRMIAKLNGFLDSPDRVLRNYAANDSGVPARMARAIAYFRMAQMDQADQLMSGLIKQYPNDPYLHDLYGQLLFESGRPKESLESYHAAVRLLPNNALMLADLGKSELAEDGASNVASAVAHLEKSTTLDNKNASAWRLLATAYGKQNNQPLSHLALSEEALLQGDVKQALSQSELAAAGLKPGSPTMQRVNDVKALALKMQKEKKDAESIF